MLTTSESQILGVVAELGGVEFPVAVHQPSLFPTAHVVCYMDESCPFTVAVEKQVVDNLTTFASPGAKVYHTSTLNSGFLSGKCKTNWGDPGQTPHR